MSAKLKAIKERTNSRILSYEEKLGRNSEMILH